MIYAILDEYIIQSVFTELWMLTYVANASVHQKVSTKIAMVLKVFMNFNFVNIGLCKIYSMAKFS